MSDVKCEMIARAAPWLKGTAQWEGVVAIQRPDVTKMGHGQKLMAKVVSARTIQLNGKRAIATYVDYALVKKYFDSDSGDHVFVEAEFKDGTIWFFNKTSNLQEWVLFSQTAELVKAVETVM